MENGRAGKVKKKKKEAEDMEQEEKKEKYQQIFPEFAGYVPEYSQSHLPVREQKTAEGHAVRAVYLYLSLIHI